MDIWLLILDLLQSVYLVAVAFYHLLRNGGFKLDEYISSKITEGTRKLQAKVDRLSANAPSISKNKKAAQKSSASDKGKQRTQKKTSHEDEEESCSRPNRARGAQPDANAKTRHTGPSN